MDNDYALANQQAYYARMAQSQGQLHPGARDFGTEATSEQKIFHAAIETTAGVRDRLDNLATRFEEIADRVLGPQPRPVPGERDNKPSAAGAVHALAQVHDGIAYQLGRLQDACDRLQRL